MIIKICKNSNIEFEECYDPCSLESKYFAFFRQTDGTQINVGRIIYEDATQRHAFETDSEICYDADDLIAIADILNKLDER